MADNFPAIAIRFNLIQHLSEGKKLYPQILPTRKQNWDHTNQARRQYSQPLERNDQLTVGGWEESSQKDRG